MRDKASLCPRSVVAEQTGSGAGAARLEASTSTMLFRVGVTMPSLVSLEARAERFYFKAAAGWVGGRNRGHVVRICPPCRGIGMRSMRIAVFVANDRSLP